MADTQNPVYTDNLTVFGDGTVDHLLSGNVSPAMAALIPKSVTITLTAAQLKAAALSIPVIPAAPGVVHWVTEVFAEYILGPGPVAFGNATGNSLNLQYDAAPSASAPARQFFGIETDAGATFAPSAQAAIDLSVNTDGSFGFGSPANNQASGFVMEKTTTVGAGVNIVLTNGNLTLGDGSVKLVVHYYDVAP